MQYAPSDFAQPTKECDVIMKGGITSGVVYPLAVTELARTYRLRNIGGTSAGAIAAALAAAAEMGRAGGGFTRLAELPGFLSQKLTALFQPSHKTRPVFRMLLTWISPGGKIRKVIASLWHLIHFHPVTFILGLLIGSGLFWLAADWTSEGQLLTSRAMPLRVISALFWGFLVAGISFLWRGIRAIRGNAFGMVTGMPSHLRSKEPALTPWMAGLLDEMAGITGQKAGGPLTFGDLQAGQINLEVMTTNLTHGVPVRLPFSSREFFFDPAEFRSFFPGPIVDWMEAHPLVPEDEDDKELIRRIVEQTPYRPLPAPADLPVVVAARMSLSFPVLISAIPLYAIDWTLKKNQELKKAGQAPELGRCWFSDGGIGSNFPVHFFDGLLPSRPTFGINLRPFHPDHPKDPYDESNNVRFPTAAGQEIRPTWTRIDGLFAFLGTILNTMQNWVDSTQMRLPGYRDRVVHVNLTDKEGGMNLAMPPDRVEALTKRGLAAGQKLQTIDWDAHRWTRYRTAMSQIQGRLDRMEELWSGGFEGFVEAHDSKTGRYQRPDAWKKYALEATTALMNTVRSWRGHPKYRLDDEPPRPEPELRITPRR